MSNMLGGKFRRQIESSIREIVFGTEDSLCSTLGTITGIAAGTQNSFVVILSGLVLIFVEAVSMAAGSYLSSKSANEIFKIRLSQDASRILQERVSDNESIADMLKRKKFSAAEIEIVFKALSKERKLWMAEIYRQENRFAPAVAISPVRSGAVMGFCYLLAGVVPLWPYFFFPIGLSIAISIIGTVIGLFGLGFVKAKIVESHWLRSGLEMMLISMTAALLGFLVGRIVAVAFGITVI
jgi:vacuolar iron transporter family protein